VQLAVGGGRCEGMNRIWSCGVVAQNAAQRVIGWVVGRAVRRGWNIRLGLRYRRRCLRGRRCEVLGVWPWCRESPGGVGWVCVHCAAGGAGLASGPGLGWGVARSGGVRRCCSCRPEPWQGSVAAWACVVWVVIVVAPRWRGVVGKATVRGGELCRRGVGAGLVWCHWLVRLTLAAARSTGDARRAGLSGIYLASDADVAGLRGGNHDVGGG